MSEREDAAAVRFPPPLIPLFAILLGVGLNAVWPIDLGFALPTPLRYWLGGLIMAGAFLGLGAPSVALFRRGDQSVIPWTPTPHIEERGPFRVTRNPMYLQMVLLCLGASILLANGWVLLFTPVTGWLLQHFAILPEEAYLERRFGEEYLAYKSRVRRWI